MFRPVVSGAGLLVRAVPYEVVEAQYLGLLRLGTTSISTRGQQETARRGLPEWHRKTQHGARVPMGPVRHSRRGRKARAHQPATSVGGVLEAPHAPQGVEMGAAPPARALALLQLIHTHPAPPLALPARPLVLGSPLGAPASRALRAPRGRAVGIPRRRAVDTPGRRAVAVLGPGLSPKSRALRALLRFWCPLPCPLTLQPARALLFLMTASPFRVLLPSVPLVAAR